jgi:hypothetical protein
MAQDSLDKIAKILKGVFDLEFEHLDVIDPQDFELKRQYDAACAISENVRNIAQRAVECIVEIEGQASQAGSVDVSYRFDGNALVIVKELRARA